MRLKDVVILRNEKTTDTSRPYIALENIISWDAKYIESSIETEGTNSVFKPNDILFGKLRPYLAKGFIPSYEGICSTEFFVLKAKKGYYTQYLLYLLLSHSFIDYIKNQVAGVKMPRTNWETFSSIEVSIPSLQVQQRIVEYLDAKTTEIDNKIELLGKKRDAYKRLKIATINHAVIRGLDEHVKLKDSGVDWIGEIPEHWKQFRLKDIGYMYSGLSGKSGEDFRSEDQSIVKPYIPFTNILYNTIVSGENFHYVVMGDEEFQNIVKKDDILFLMSSEDYESIAKSAVVLDDFGEIFLNSFCRGLRITQNTAYAPFVNYQLNSTIYRDALRFEARGFTRINIKIDRIESHIVTLPPLEEQKQIAAYLDDRCAKIDEAVTIIDKQIDALKRLKRSLINEVVTGKRMV